MIYLHLQQSKRATLVSPLDAIMTVTPALLQQTVFSHPSITSFNPYSRAVFLKLKNCHTMALGFHRLQCDDQQCGHTHWQYHSCGNRHCPGCGSWKKEQWIDFKTAELLPTAYYHVVFTLPHACVPECRYYGMQA